MALNSIYLNFLLFSNKNLHLINVLWLAYMLIKCKWLTYTNIIKEFHFHQYYSSLFAIIKIMNEQMKALIIFGSFLLEWFNAHKLHWPSTLHWFLKIVIFQMKNISNPIHWCLHVNSQWQQSTIGKTIAVVHFTTIPKYLKSCSWVGK